jgi:hypothetical protein
MSLPVPACATPALSDPERLLAFDPERL